MGVWSVHQAEAVPSPAGPAGTIQTMGGTTRNYQKGGYGDASGLEGGPATLSQFQNPRGLAFAPNGDIYIGDSFNHRVRRIDGNGMVHLVAGDGTTSTLNEPHGVAVDSLGNVYIADSKNCVVRRVDTAGVMTRFAGTGAKDQNGACVRTAGTPDGNALEIALNEPKSLSMSRSGGTETLWIADWGNNQIRRIDVATNGTPVAIPQNVRVAGTARARYFGGDGGDALNADFRHPEAVWVAGDGTVYVSDRGNNLIRKIAMPAPNTTVRKVTVIAGDVAAAIANASFDGDLVGNSDGDGGLAVNAHVDQPGGIAGDNQGNLYVAEVHGSRIRRINLVSGSISTIAGDGTFVEQRTSGGSLAIKGDPSGAALEAQFEMVRDIQINPADGSLWIADSRNCRIRAIISAATAPGANIATGGGAVPPPPPPPTSSTTTSSTTTSTTTSSTSTTTTTTMPSTPPGVPTIGSGTGSTNTGAAALYRSGYWMVGTDGVVYPFGDAKAYGNASTSSAVDIEPTPSGNGYWVVDDQGQVFGFGDAAGLGNVDRRTLAVGEKVTSLSATSNGHGYWIFTNRGRVITFGNATHLGDVSNLKLAGPVLDSIVTPSGAGYYMVASDGGIFAFGDAVFYGSMGGRKLNAPVQSLVPDSDGIGYWLVASDGGIFAFEAGFKGSMGGTRLNKPVTGMVRAGTGYLMVGEDGGIFDFSGTPDGFKGSLGASPPAKPIASVAMLEIRS